MEQPQGTRVFLLTMFLGGENLAGFLTKLHDIGIDIRYGLEGPSTPDVVGVKLGLTCGDLSPSVQHSGVILVIARQSVSDAFEHGRNLLKECYVIRTELKRKSIRLSSWLSKMRIPTHEEDEPNGTPCQRGELGVRRNEDTSDLKVGAPRLGESLDLLTQFEEPGFLLERIEF